MSAYPSARLRAKALIAAPPWRQGRTFLSRERHVRSHAVLIAFQLFELISVCFYKRTLNLQLQHSTASMIIIVIIYKILTYFEIKILIWGE